MRYLLYSLLLPIKKGSEIGKEIFEIELNYYRSLVKKKQEDKK